MVKVLLFLFITVSALAQEKLPEDNSFSSYHPAPHYRESESHPLRIVSYIFHPIGWAFREFFFRPISHYMSDSPTRRSIFGYRDPYDFRNPSCYAPELAYNCKQTSPFNYKGTDYRSGPNNINRSNQDSIGDQGIVESSFSNSTNGSFYLPNVNFDFNKRKLNDLGKGRVNEIYELLKTNDNVNIILEGHTDSVGKDSYNEKLGLNRADVVKSELIKLGISKDRLSTVTFGEKNPKSTNKDWGNAVNRRVEVKVN